MGIEIHGSYKPLISTGHIQLCNELLKSAQNYTTRTFDVVISGSFNENIRVIPATSPGTNHAIECIRTRGPPVLLKYTPELSLELVRLLRSWSAIQDAKKESHIQYRGPNVQRDEYWQRVDPYRLETSRASTMLKDSSDKEQESLLELLIGLRSTKWLKVRYSDLPGQILSDLEFRVTALTSLAPKTHAIVSYIKSMVSTVPSVSGNVETVLSNSYIDSTFDIRNDYELFSRLL